MRLLTCSLLEAAASNALVICCVSTLGVADGGILASFQHRLMPDLGVSWEAAATYGREYGIGSRSKMRNADLDSSRYALIAIPARTIGC